MKSSDKLVRVLVVDDEYGMREGCRRILEPEGYAVETAEDGAAGLDLFRNRGPFAIALVDLQMPRMGGMELIPHLREIDEDIVIFVITAYATIETAVEATHRGAYGYIPKPFTPDELLLPVRNGLEHRALSIEAKQLRREREHRLLEVAFERSKASTIIGCMTDGVLVINRDKGIVLRNNGMMRIFPSCGEFSLPAPLSALKCGPLEEIILEVIAGGGAPVIASREVPLGKSVYMVNASPVLEPAGDVMGAVAVLRDITTLKKLDEAKSVFVSMVAHEVKGPLAAVENYLDILRTGNAVADEEKKRAILDRCSLRIGALRNMVSELIDLTAIQTGHFAIKRTILDIRETVAEAIDACREKAAAKGQDIHILKTSSLERTRILADPRSLLIICTNLIDNAIKYTQDAGRIEIELEENGLFVRLHVRDNGIGISKEEQEHIFEDFYRAKNEYTRQVPGTGLGLSLVKKLVECHEGAVSVQSAPGNGTLFTVSLPIMDGAR